MPAQAPSSPFPPWFALFPAVLGQYFMAQADKPFTLVPGLLLYAAALWTFRGSGPAAARLPAAQPARLSPKREWSLLALILVSAFFFRVYRIGEIPSGLHTDEGLIGQCALRILHGGWRPFSEVFDYQVPELLLFYQLAAWFGLAGSSSFTFHLFFILLSLAAFPLAYGAFRQWAGPRTALLSLFILAVMRWNWIESRNGYPSIQVPFYLFGALAFWTYGLRSGRKGALFLSAFFVGAGFYGYQALKVVPFLMMLFALYETLRFRRGKGTGGSLSLKNFRPLLFYFLLVLVLILPLLTVMARKGMVGHRESDIFIGTKILQERSLKPLWDAGAATALMFNRAGDGNPRHNIPGRRMLDDVTAVFFLLGLGLAWRRRREPEGFYPLVGFLVLSLPGLLSTDAAPSNRLVALTPFVAYFAGSALDCAWQSAKASFKGKRIPFFGLVLLLAGMAAQNAHTYFIEQGGDIRCQEAFGLEQNLIGRNIEAAAGSFPGQNRYFITPAYFQNHTVDFLADPARADLAEFNLRDWAEGKVPRDKAAVVFLEGDKPGVLEFLKVLCPAMGVLPYRDSRGRTRMNFCVVSPEALRALKPWTRGLEGSYWEGPRWSGPTLAVRRDPVLNFTSKFDFPFTHYPPFRIRWTGALDLSRAGEYRFQVLSTDDARLWLDGRPVPLEKPFRLAAGAHALRLDFQKDSGDSLALTFIWQKPGDDKWEVVPATALGSIQGKAR